MINIDGFNKIKALVIGDLMIDEYLWGNVERISPEAPVPVFCVKNRSYRLGGAGNVINNLFAMGAGVSVVGIAGKGKAGQMIYSKLRDLGIAIDGIVNEPERPTTRKTRVIASNQQVLRIDREIKRDVSPDTIKKLIKIIENKILRVDVIILSDYGKGLLTRKVIQAVVRLAKKYGVLTLADPKSLNFSKYKNVSVLTPNRKEASLAANIDFKSKDDFLLAGRKILNDVKLKKLLITCGKDGMMLFEKNKKPCFIKSNARQVFDVSGAGDTVISILGLGLASGASFKKSAQAANAAAGIVVAKIGTATASINELKQKLADLKL